MMLAFGIGSLAFGTGGGGVDGGNRAPLMIQKYCMGARFPPSTIRKPKCRGQVKSWKD